jgi:hypothetical protein
MARNSGTRQDTWMIILTVGGNTFGIWDKKSGGEVDSEENKYYPGGMQPAQDLGGRITPGNVTLSRIYDRHDDHDRINALIAAAGKQTCTVSQRPLDINGNPVGKPIIYKGKLKRVSLPDTDGESSTAAMVEVEVSVSAPPSAV